METIANLHDSAYPETDFDRTAVDFDVRKNMLDQRPDRTLAGADRHIETFTTTWNGIALEITYEPCWLSLPHHLGPSVAHLAVCSVSPFRAPLPITKTGYRSYFTSAEAVAAFGSPVEFVLAWLDESAHAPAWRNLQAATRQLSLF